MRTYGVTRLDMDVEDRSLSHLAGIDRRNRALRLVERVGRAHRAPPPDRIHAPRRAGRARVGRPARAAKRGPQRHPRRRRQHHDLRLLRRRRPPTWARRRSAPPAACTASCTRSTRTAARAALWAMEGITHPAGHRRLPAEDRGDVRSPTPPAVRRFAALDRASAPSRSGRSSATTAAARAGSTRTRARASSSRDWAFSHLLEPFTRAGPAVSLRVVGAGLGRTGTNSLKLALERLLGGPCYHMVEVIERPDDVPVWHDGDPRRAARLAHVPGRIRRHRRLAGVRVLGRARRRPSRTRSCCSRCARAPRPGGGASRRPSPPASPAGARRPARLGGAAQR